MKKGARKADPKVQLSVTVSGDLVNFMDQEIEKKIYSSRSHAVDRALQELKDRKDKQS
jgi:Arc/MetJ-type ribon-helix-helix transcriptional regulator